MQLFTPGLVSVSFRKFSPKQIIELCADAGLVGLEWGGDIHVPPGDLANAKEVGEMTRDEGLRVAAYGSYYRAGDPKKSGGSFDSVLQTALALGAPRIRVWAGVKGSADTSPAEWAATVADLLEINKAAAEQNVQVCLEYHAGTLADSLESVGRLLQETPESLRFLWQPSSHYSREQRLEALPQVLARLAHVHVYYWFPGNERRPLAEGEAEWLPYLNTLAANGVPRELLLEFVREDSEQQLRADAATLREWIAKVTPARN